MKPSDFAKILERYIKPTTFPIGFKLVEDEEIIPEKARRFSDITICQAYNMARRYRWTVYFDGSTSCPIGLVAYGFSKPDELYESGELAHHAGYASSREAGMKCEKEVAKLEHGKYRGVLVFPLERDETIPDFAVVYGNPAQILRFVHAIIYDEGGALTTKILGRASCSEFLDAYLSDEPRFILPCYGDRIFGLTQDDEVAFVFPWHFAEKISRNLEATHRRGIRYPVPVTALRIRVILPESYEESLKNMRKLDQ